MGGDNWFGLIRNMAGDRHYARSKAERALGFARALPLFRSCETGAHVCATGYVRVKNRGRVTVGDRVTFMGGMLATELLCGPDASIEIGDDSILNYGVSIDASGFVRIGERCMVASMVRISDAQNGYAYPIRIGNDVWIAHGAIIEPGISIGDSSVVAAGSVVTRDVPPHSLAIGNPARNMMLEVVA